MKIDAQEVINRQSQLIGNLKTENLILELELEKAQEQLKEQGATDAG